MNELIGNINKKPVIQAKALVPKASIPPDENKIPDQCFFFETDPPAFIRKGCRDADRYLMELLTDLANAEKTRLVKPPDDPRGMVLYYRRWMLAYLACAHKQKLDLEEFEKMVRGWHNWDIDNGPEDLDNAVHKNIRDLGIVL